MSKDVQMRVDVAKQVAVDAGKILQKSCGHVTYIREKQGKCSNLVTQADHISEKFIVEHLRKCFPQDYFISEEVGLLKPLSEEKTVIWPEERDEYSHELEIDKEELSKAISRGAWIIDPLDGTTNFAHRHPHFAVSIAWFFEGKVRLGVIYHPSSGELFWAHKEKGAFLGEEKICTSACQSLSQALVATGFSFNDVHKRSKSYREFLCISEKVKTVRRSGSAVLDLAYVACGRLDAFWGESLYIWDVGAGVLMVEEACGQVSDLSSFRGEINWLQPKIVASCAKLHHQLMDHLHFLQEKPSFFAFSAAK